MKYILTIINVFTFYFFGHGQNKTIHVSNYIGSRIEIRSSGEKPEGNFNAALQCMDVKTKDTIGNYNLFVNGVKINNGNGHSKRFFFCKGKTSITVSADGYKTAVIENKHLEADQLSQIKVFLRK